MSKQLIVWTGIALLIVLGLSTITITGWINHKLELARIEPNYVVMQFNTALCMLLCATGTALLFTRQRVLIWMLMSVVLTISSLTLAEYMLAQNLYIDRILLPTDYDPSINMRTGFNTALALFLTATTILLAALRKTTSRRAILIAVIASLVFALGAVPLLGYVGNIQEAYRFGTFTRMSLPSSLCFPLLASVLTLYAGHRSNTLHRWLPLPVFLALVTISFAGALVVHMHERQQIEQLLQTRVNEQALYYNSHIEEVYAALNRISRRWEAAGGTPHELWQQDTQSYNDDMPFVAEISWVDETNKITWVSPELQNTALIGKDLTQDPVLAAALEETKNTHQSRVTPPVPLFLNYGLGYLYIRPIFIGGEYHGAHVTAIKLQELIGTLIQKDQHQKEYYYALEYGDKVLLTNMPTSPDDLKEWRTTATFKNLNEEYRLVLYPTAEFLNTQTSHIAALVLGTGLVMSGLIAFSVLVMLNDRRRSRMLEVATQFNNEMVDSATYLIIALDTQGLVLLFNTEAEKILGYEAEEVIDKQHMLDWYDPLEIEEYTNAIRTRLKNNDLSDFDAFTFEANDKGRFENEWSILRKDGTCFPGRLSITPRFNPNGKLEGYLCIIKDLTEQKQQEAKLRTSEETFRLTMQESPIGIALVSLEGHWMKVNEALCELIGYTQQELLRTDFQTITHPDDLATDLGLVQQVLDGSIKSYALEKRYFHKKGYQIKILLHVALIRYEDGTPKHFISMIQDVTERDRLMEQLRHANIELEQFAYVASHDLQEPLRMVTSFVSLIGTEYEDKLDAIGREYITISVDAAKRMQTLINDLLDYARSGRESQVNVTINSDTEMKHVLQNLANLIKGTHAKVTVGTLPKISGNPVEFLRLMQNLIGNGIKFHRKDVQPEIEVAAIREQENWVFSVKDNGIGIKQDYLEKIFQPFKRLHTQEEYHGSGIGLAVCRKIVENLGGRIWIESAYGSGSTIYFSVPALKEHI